MGGRQVRVSEGTVEKFYAIFRMWTKQVTRGLGEDLCNFLERDKVRKQGALAGYLAQFSREGHVWVPGVATHNSTFMRDNA